MGASSLRRVSSLVVHVTTFYRPPDLNARIYWHTPFNQPSPRWQTDVLRDIVSGLAFIKEVVNGE